MAEIETFYDRIKNKGTTSGETPPDTSSQVESGAGEKPAEENKGEQTSQVSDGETSGEKTSFDISGINKHFNKSFESEQQLQDLFEQQEKFKDFESQLTSKNEELKTAQDKYTQLLDNFDPEKLIANKETIALSQLSEKYPNADLGILANVRKADLDSLDKLDALVLINKLTVPSSVSDSVRKTEILRKLGIEEDADNLTEVDRFRIESEFADKRTLLNEIREFQVEMPKFDFEAEKKTRDEQAQQDAETLNTHNEKALKILLDGFKEVKSQYNADDKKMEYKYIVADSFGQENFKELLDYFNNSKFKITTDNAEEAKRFIENTFWILNKQKIIEDAIKQTISSGVQDTHNAIHSDSPSNTTEAPAGDVKKVPTSVMDSYRQGKMKR